MDEFGYHFEWNPAKAAGNLRKHGVSFELACTIFSDLQILSVPDLEHGEERWFSVGTAKDGSVLSVAYTWTEADGGETKVRIISARKATASEIRAYLDQL